VGVNGRTETGGHFEQLPANFVEIVDHDVCSDIYIQARYATNFYEDGGTFIAVTY